MSLKVAIQMDPIEGIHITTDTSFMMMMEAQARGHSLWVYQPEHLSQLGQRVFARGRSAVLKAVQGNAIELVSAWGGKTYREEGFDSVVLVYGSVAKHDLYDQLKADGSIAQLYLAGAAWLPRHMSESTRHGANIGLAI